MGDFRKTDLVVEGNERHVKQLVVVLEIVALGRSVHGGETINHQLNNHTNKNIISRDDLISSHLISSHLLLGFRKW